MYSNYPVTKNGSTYYPDEERFFWAPFVVGGLAGTALGYGIANNQQMNQQPYYYPYPMTPVYYYPPYSTISSNNNYYY